MRPPVNRSAPVHLYDHRLDDLPITGGQALLQLNGSGAGTASVGPTGLGTVWYPASVVFGTSVTPFDSSIINVYVGPAGVPTALQGTLITGGVGVVSLAIPAMSPGLYIIAVWSGGTAGSTVSMNVTGSMSALVRPS
jgi:hypothetical protein